MVTLRQVGSGVRFTLGLAGAIIFIGFMLYVFIVHVPLIGLPFAFVWAMLTN